MNLYDKGYVWKMETPPANSNHLLEEEEEKIMAEDSEDSDDSSLYQDTLSTHDPSPVSSSSSSPTSSSSSSSYSFLSCEEDNDEDEDHHNHQQQQDQSPPRSSSTGGRGKDLRLLFAPAINLATHINVVLTPLQEMMNFEDRHNRHNRKDPPIFAGRTLLSSTFHVAVPWRPTTIAHLARYLEMKLYEEQGLRKEAPPPPESGSSSIWPWPFALYVRTAVNEYQPTVRSLTMDDLRREPATTSEHHRHLAYEPAYHLITLYYTHARELLRAMRRSSSSPMKKKSKKRSKRSKEEKKKAKKEKKKAKKEMKKMKMKKRKEEKKKAKKSRPNSAAFLPFTDGPSTSGATAPPSLSFSSSSSWSLGSD